MDLVGYRFHDLGVSFDGQDGNPLLCAIATAGDDGEHLSFVGKVHSQCKCSIGLKPDGFAAYGLSLIHI